MKDLVIFLSLVGIVLLGIVGCSSDEKEPEMPIVDIPPAPQLPEEGVVGSWDVVLLGGEEPGTLALIDPDETVKHFYYRFTADNKVTLNLKIELALKELDFPQRAKFVWIVTWSGTYVLEDSTLSMSWKKMDVDLKPEPKNLLERVGVAEAELIEDIWGETQDFRFTDRHTYDLQGDTLILQLQEDVPTDENLETVLKRQ